ncbi:zonular occludens toxin domain-containing protein [Ferrimonas pelagia]|uniref:Zonular occludens toxin domain-containing protein n=1 Tax=Ferrimonas pelagia TaxID=1177826 RepID=A0ABP9F4M5_9GAMM
MAISFRYGPAGSYKSAAAIWFDLLPALKAGRLCYTNVEGMQPLHIIEKRLNTRFPESTKLVRISSRNSEGIELWRNWYNWLPIGAFVLLDEAQDIFGAATGFKMVSYPAKPVENFLHHLPPDHKTLFYSRWVPVESIDDGELDDTGRTQFDDNGRLLYPFDFNGACMRHRKYNWDLVMCTPDFKQIPSEVKGVAEIAKQHRSKDSFSLTRRKPRIFEHHPTKTVSDPAKGDFTYRQKVPLDVHLLYSSTGTGQVTKSGAQTSILSSPRVVLSLVGGVAAIAYFVWFLIGVFTDDKKPATAVAPPVASSMQTDVSPPGQRVDQGWQDPIGLSYRGDSAPGDPTALRSPAYLASFYPVKPYKEIYFTGYSEVRSSNRFERLTLFNVVTEHDVFPVTSKDLAFFGVSVIQYSDCVIKLKKGELERFVGCMPFDDRFPIIEQPQMAQLPAQMVPVNVESPIKM